MKRKAAQNVSLPIAIRERLRVEAVRRDVPVSFVVRRALEAYFAHIGGSDGARDPLERGSNEG